MSYLYKLSIIIILLLITVILTPNTSFTTNTQDISNQAAIEKLPIQNIFRKNIINADTTFGIVVWDLNTGQKHTLNEGEQFESASLYKLAVMYNLFYLESKGVLNTDQPNIKKNLDLMITVSSNEASLYLVDNYTSWDEITNLMLVKGLKKTVFNNSTLLTTPEDIAALLFLINDPNDISPEARNKMMELLRNQEINDRIPELLPVGATVYHKTGEVNGSRHDAGIVTNPSGASYILVIMTKDSDMPEEIKHTMAKISSEIYELFSK